MKQAAMALLSGLKRHVKNRKIGGLMRLGRNTLRQFRHKLTLLVCKTNTKQHELEENKQSKSEWNDRAGISEICVVAM